MPFRRGLGSTSQDRTTWLALLALVFGVVAPAACVIWFMNEAMANQADASRQRVFDAYRGQLRLLRERLDTEWRTSIGQALVAGRSDAQIFQRSALTGGADALIFSRPDGTVRYPDRPVSVAPDRLEGTGQWELAQELEDGGYPRGAATIYATLAAGERDASIAARALQAQLRALNRAGERAAAIRLVQDRFTTGRLMSGRDRLGRLIAVDAQILALRLMSAADTRRDSAASRLAALVDDYEGVDMPSAQRLFAMNELAGLGYSRPLPTIAAERLADEFLQVDGAPATGSALELSALRDVWKIRIGDGVTALYRTETIRRAAQRVLAPTDAAGDEVRFSLAAPGEPTGDDALAAGPLLPGWQLSVAMAGSRLPDLRRQTSVYLWTGTVAIAVLAIGGLLIWQAFQRQLRLARLKTDLVAAVSHELKTPLASMRLLVESLLEESAPEGSKTREYLLLVAGENARLTRLIEHFLTFSRVERRPRFAFAAVHPHDIVGTAVGLVRDRFDPSHHLNVDVEPDLPHLRGDQDALVTVLLNLLENAYLYTSAEKRIALRAFRDADRVVFEVEDNGIGISRRDQRRVFRRFYRVDQRLARESSGCGLGLTIVDYIVKAHGGGVALSSQLGVGSRFRISLPAMDHVPQGAR